MRPAKPTKHAATAAVVQGAQKQAPSQTQVQHHARHLAGAQQGGKQSKTASPALSREGSVKSGPQEASSRRQPGPRGHPDPRGRPPPGEDAAGRRGGQDRQQSRQERRRGPGKPLQRDPTMEGPRVGDGAPPGRRPSSQGSGPSRSPVQPRSASVSTEGPPEVPHTPPRAPEPRSPALSPRAPMQRDLSSADGMPQVRRQDAWRWRAVVWPLGCCLFPSLQI